MLICFLLHFPLLSQLEQYVCYRLHALETLFDMRLVWTQSYINM